ncbi:MAG TPA: hypothetical protein DC042_02880, partial [Bacteroidales bacterium]|nr:hypothetical protein [Bacteroidales bacterium]
MNDTDSITIGEVINTLLFEIQPERIVDKNHLYHLFFSYFGLCTYHYVNKPNHREDFEPVYVVVNSDDEKAMNEFYEHYEPHKHFFEDGISVQLRLGKNYKPDLADCFGDFRWENFEKIEYTITIYHDWDSFDKFEYLFVGNYLPISAFTYQDLKSKFYTDIFDL